MSFTDYEHAVLSAVTTFIADDVANTISPDKRDSRHQLLMGRRVVDADSTASTSAFLRYMRFLRFSVAEDKEESSKGNRRSRFPSGMEDRKASATATADAAE